MSKNIKIGNDTLNGVTTIKFEDADSAGTYDEFLDTTDANAVASDIKDGKTAYVNGVKITGNHTDKTEQTKTEALSMASGDQVVTPDTNKVLTQVTITKPATLVPGNIKKDVVIGGVTGSYEGGVTPTGTINITENGTVDVTNYATANVSVSGGGAGFAITTNVTGGTASGSTATGAAPTKAYVTIAPTSPYLLPADVTVTNATKNYNSTSGVIELTNATDNVVVTVVCATQYTITTNVSHGTASGDTTIVSDRTASVTIHASAGYATPDTITVTGATYTYNKTSGIIKLSSATGNVTINVVCEESQDIVTKGQIITMNLDGTDKQYRVLKVSNTIAEVLSMSDASSQQFASSGQTYENGVLDTYLNSTWYNTLSATAKAAIVDRTFRQDSWYWGTQGNPDYQGKYSGDTAYQLSLGNASFGNEITRHAYAISVQDVLDYLEVTPQMTQADTTLTYDNVWTMFWNSTTTHNGNIWLRSANASNASYAFYVIGDFGSLYNRNAYTSNAVRPALTIDLSKIEWN